MSRILVLITAASLWSATSFYTPYLTPELLGMKVSATIAGVIVACRPLAQMFARVPLGIRSARRGTHKQMIVAGTGCGSLAAIVMYFFPTPAMICVGCAIAGFAGASYVGITVLYRQYFGATQGEKAMGTLGTVVEAGSLMSYVVGGILYQHGGIRALFLAGACVAFVGFVASFFVKDVQLPRGNETVKSTFALLKNRVLAVSTILTIMIKILAFGTVFSFTPKLAQDLGANGTQLGIINALFMAASMIGSFFVATRAGRKVGDVRMCIIGFVMLCFYCGTLPFMRSLPSFMVVQFTGGLGYEALSAVLMANCVRTLAPDQKAAGMGLYQALYSLGMFLGSVIVGSLVDIASYKGAYLTLAVISATGVVLTVWAGRKGVLTKAERRVNA